MHREEKITLKTSVLFYSHELYSESEAKEPEEYWDKSDSGY